MSPPFQESVALLLKSVKFLALEILESSSDMGDGGMFEESPAADEDGDEDGGG